MPHLVVCGLNYHTSAISVRERFSMPASCLEYGLAALMAMPHVSEAAILSTCNRFEVYAVLSELQAGFCELNSFFAAVQSVGGHEALAPNFRLIGDDVALHLFRVAAGLDSLILGEGQIQSQIKNAHQAALKANASGAVLNYLFNSAINCGKRTRTETELGKCSVSVSSAAVKLAEREMGRLHRKDIMVLGTGKMGHLCLKELAGKQRAGKLVVANRSKYKVNGIFGASASGSDRIAQWTDFTDRHVVAATADIVFVATGAPGFVIEYDSFALARQGCEKDICIIDISVPRNVDPRVAELPGVQLFYADDLRTLIGVNLPHLERLIQEAEVIIFEKLEEFQKWQRALYVVPTICDLHQKLESIRIEQTAKARSSRAAVIEQRIDEQMERLGRAIVAQILHEPTARLKEAPSSSAANVASTSLRSLFNLGLEQTLPERNI